MNLFFQNSLGKERLIASDLSSKQECYDEINKFLDDHNSPLIIAVNGK